MRISPALLLLLLVLLVFAPFIEDWASQGGTQWYRPYLLWLGVVVFVRWVVNRGGSLVGSPGSAKSGTGESR